MRMTKVVTIAGGRGEAGDRPRTLDASNGSDMVGAPHGPMHFYDAEARSSTGRAAGTRTLPVAPRPPPVGYLRLFFTERLLYPKATRA